MSRTIVQVLKHYRELKDVGPESELFHTKHDIERAVQEAPLTSEEREIVEALYFDEPENPVRQEGSGRPKSAWAANIVGLELENKSENAKEIFISRRLRSAIGKLSEWLGDDYEF